MDNHGNPLRPSATPPVRGPTSGSSRRTDRGSGPGAITPDGCAVDLYALLPPMGEPELVHAAIPAGASILELGAGAGRMTARLVELGHPVVAVDESAEMLAHVRGAETVRARIQDLELGRRFDAVLLASFLVNTPDRALRGAFLRALQDTSPFTIVGEIPARPGVFDPAQMEQVLINLVKNAREAGAPGDSITMEVQPHAGGWRIQVLDRGSGMSDEVLGNALLPFYSTKSAGAGLGLTVCREVIEAHGGRISLANRPEGGLIVTLWIPEMEPEE